MSNELGDGTQILPLKDAYDAPCRCGRGLTWDYLNHAEITATAECECGMCYTAMFPTITIEGLDRNLN